MFLRKLMLAILFQAFALGLMGESIALTVHSTLHQVEHARGLAKGVLPSEDSLPAKILEADCELCLALLHTPGLHAPKVLSWQTSTLFSRAVFFPESALNVQDENRYVGSARSPPYFYNSFLRFAS